MMLLTSDQLIDLPYHPASDRTQQPVCPRLPGSQQHPLAHSWHISHNLPRLSHPQLERLEFIGRAARVRRVSDIFVCQGIFWTSSSKLSWNFLTDCEAPTAPSLVSRSFSQMIAPHPLRSQAAGHGAMSRTTQDHKANTSPYPAYTIFAPLA